MEQQIAILNWLQNNPEILSKWYNNKMSAEEVVTEYNENKIFNYYLIGDDAVDIYNDGYENGIQQIIFGADAVNCADVLGRVTYDVFKEEIGVTTIAEFQAAIDKSLNWISISKEEYLKLEK